VYRHRFSSLSLETLLRIVTTGGEMTVLRLSLIKLATMNIIQVVMTILRGRFVEQWHYVEQTVSCFIKHFSKLIIYSFSYRRINIYNVHISQVISPDPDDPNKTRFSLLALANPGGGIPNWALKTAVNALAPIEPFKLFAKIEKNVNKVYTEDDKSHTQTNSKKLDKRSRPAGLSQLGYACFWPNGINGASSNQNHDSVEKMENGEKNTDISVEEEYYDSCVDG